MRTYDLSHHHLVHIHGLGDWMQSESFYTDQERRDLKSILHASRSTKPFIEIMKACPPFQHVEQIVWKPPDDLPCPLPPSTYWSQGCLRRRTFTGSSFLRHTLAEIPHLDIPDRYHLLHVTTPFNYANERAIRDMRGEEWQPLLSRLEALDTYGVVLNSQPEPIPDHPLLVDLQGLTTMPESIEILKRADGYFGIDSCLAILAAQWFAAENLWIRTRNPRVVEFADVYYPPHQTHPFLVPDFNSKPYVKAGQRPIDKGMTLIRVYAPLLIGSHHYTDLDVVEVDESTAKRLIESGHARAYDPADLPKPVQTATRKIPRKAAKFAGRAE